MSAYLSHVSVHLSQISHLLKGLDTESADDAVPPDSTQGLVF